MEQAKKVAVILAGCGHKDGSEITEAVSVLVALSEVGAQYECFAPDVEFEAVDHLTGQPTGKKRNARVEAARIARGNVKDLASLHAKDFDGVVLPGGLGASKILSTWSQQGARGHALADVARVLREFKNASKPIAAICIAPAVVAQVLGSDHVTVTVGHDTETAMEIEKTGAIHVNCKVDDFVTDRENKIITTPAYMYDAKPFQVFKGIRSAILEFFEMA